MRSTVRRDTRFYLDTEDTTKEVGITRRQLTYWQQEGLLVPEFGAGAKKFTESDIRRLRVLKRLIVEQNLPLSFVKQIVERETDFAVTFVRDLIESGALLSSHPNELTHRVLDFDRGGLVAAEAYADEIWTAKLAIASEEEIQEQFYTLALLLFRTILATQNHPVAYQERRDKIVQQILLLSDIARLKWHFRKQEGVVMASFSFEPTLPNSGDHEKAYYDMVPDFVYYAQRLESFAKTVEEPVGRGDVSSSVSKRYWPIGLAREVESAVEDDRQFNLFGRGDFDVPF